jgi:hypothetical protein
MENSAETDIGSRFAYNIDNGKKRSDNKDNQSWLKK